MTRYIAGRCLAAIVLALLILTVVFAALRVVPGDPARLLLSGTGDSPSPAAVQALREKLNLDEPIHIQYVNYVTDVVRLDLGTSLQDGEPVSKYVAVRLPRTLELILTATVLALIAGIPLGAVAASRRGGLIDGATSLLASTGISVPVYVTGTLLVLLFALKLGWTPAGGYVGFLTDPARHVQLLSLPAATLAVNMTAITTRMTRSAILEVSMQDWVRTAHAKGLPPMRAFLRHVLRNSMRPVITVVGLEMGVMLGGTVLVEHVFNWPGLSSLLIDGVTHRDYPLVQGIVLIISILFVIINLLVDLSYAALDPRVRYR